LPYHQAVHAAVRAGHGKLAGSSFPLSASFAHVYQKQKETKKTKVLSRERLSSSLPLLPYVKNSHDVRDGVYNLASFVAASVVICAAVAAGACVAKYPDTAQ
jgi:hypothetical protein